MYSIYTDGACSGNPGAGGYAAIITNGTLRQTISGGFRLTTNNRMEITAVIRALLLVPTGQRIVVYSDSSLVVDAIRKGWLKRWIKEGKLQSKANADLWAQLDSVLKDRDVVFMHVYGHDGVPENEECDRMAVNARKQDNLPADKGYEDNLNKTEKNVKNDAVTLVASVVGEIDAARILAVLEENGYAILQK